MDFAFKLASKLLALFGAKHIKRVDKEDGTSALITRTSPDELDDEEKDDDEWPLTNADARRTATLSASTCVANNELMMPLYMLLCPG